MRSLQTCFMRMSSKYPMLMRFQGCLIVSNESHMTSTPQGFPARCQREQGRETVAPARRVRCKVAKVLRCEHSLRNGAVDGLVRR